MSKVYITIKPFARHYTSSAHPFRILHVPDRGYEQYRRKIRNGATAVAHADLDPRICAHWREEAAMLEDGSFSDVYHGRRHAAATRLASGALVRDTRLRDRLEALMSVAVLPAELEKILDRRPDRRTVRTT